ncbi:hypothetical protein MCOR31_006606 [Pyricularia oryzae]|nr:hypothetical protein MCOR31_006606 [Pyricularia oryzae]KAI6434492.1 hypothetical protein MCOR22_009443 [Pyricularia oryzae]KAI6486365.1 hypothetical protein MCOR11_009316 [Pyricularia oryzae]
MIEVLEIEWVIMSFLNLLQLFQRRKLGTTCFVTSGVQSELLKGHTLARTWPLAQSDLELLFLSSNGLVYSKELARHNTCAVPSCFRRRSRWLRVIHTAATDYRVKFEVRGLVAESGPRR